jgi:hypothetical protein
MIDADHPTAPDNEPPLMKRQGRGHSLPHEIPPADVPGGEDDPILGAFLGFVEVQIANRPDLAKAFTEADVAGLDDLLEGVESSGAVDWDEFELP